MVAGAPRARRTAVALALGGALVMSAACGARWSDEERAAVYARNTAGATNADGASVGEGAATSTTLAGAETAVDDAAGGAGAGPVTGGTTGGDAGGTTGGPTASGPSPCAAPSDAPGVTAEKITVGSISTVSGPLPGLGESSMAAVRAYAAYRNATGGVCGRQVEVKTGDDGAENGRFRALVTDMAATTLGLAGGLGAGDGGGIDVINANKLPIVATAYSDTFEAVPTVFDINPPFANPRAVIGKYRYLYGIGVRTASLVTLATAGTKSQLDTQQNLMEAAGIKIVDRQELPLSTLSWDASARRVANSKADYLFYLGAGNLNSSMARSMKDSGYTPKVSEYLTAYGSDFIAQAGDAAEGATSWPRVLPAEEAGSNRELSAFLEWMERIAPGIPADVFAADAWASAKAFLDSVEALPGPISRDALVAQLRSVATYDADGMFGPIKLGQKASNGCAVGMKVVGGTWRRLTPERGFLC